MKYSPDNTKIAMIGGGNIGTQFACICASKGYKVNVLSSRPDLYDGRLEVLDEYDKLTTAKINLVSSDIGEVVNGCRIIFVTHPAFRLYDVAKKLYAFADEDMHICVLPGTGGAEFAFNECIKAGATLSGIQRVPSVARLEQYGKRVICKGLRSELFVASIPKGQAQDMADLLSLLWGIPCHILPNYLNVTLTPSNPILHTTRLRTLFADYRADLVYCNNPLFYGDWDDASSELLIACDSELQEMIARIKELDLSGVKSLKDHYESYTVEDMTAKIRSIDSLHDLRSPMKHIQEGWIPDFTSRYFTADFPYGLAIIEALAEVLECNVPRIKETMRWYRNITDDTNRFDLGRFGISSLDDIYNYY